eukprot:m.338024 g.338024  ORF g.338024 m.338024 type:complete len:371 (+) comp18292_c0_seq1:182-1294(+)
MSKPAVLVLGGCGMVGQNLVKHLVDNDLAAKIRVADKVPPMMAYLLPEFKAAFDAPIVEFMQGNLASEASVKKVFTPEEGTQPYSIVFNCAAMTKFGQEEEVYNENILKLSTLCATEAASNGVKLFVEMSTAQVYASSKAPATEDGKTKPWTVLATKKLEVEKKLADIEGLHYVIVRPGIIYGPGDKTGIMPRLITAAVYAKLGETMKMLWSAKLKLNTVHVEDVVNAMWLLASKEVERGSVYNLADKNDTSQGSLNAILCEMFGIKDGYFGNVMSNMAKLNMTSSTETANEKHLAPWMSMLQDAEIGSTPLSPYLDKELLYNHDTYVNGEKIESLGFQYKHPEIKKDDLVAYTEAFIDAKLFPPGFLKK